MRIRMQRKTIPLSAAIFLLIAGLFLGSVFTFGMQYWNKPVTKEACTQVHTQFIASEENRRLNRITHVREILIDCANGERYSIDGACINETVQEAVAALYSNENISLLIHPNSDTIVAFSTDEGPILLFEDTIEKLNNEATGFLFLGVFMYICAIVGLYHVVLISIKKHRAKKR